MSASERTEAAASPSARLVEIDGSVLEGGGQILRVAAALSAITGKQIRVNKIRANRSKPGLRPQHLAGLQLLSRTCDGELEGAKVGSSSISLVPHERLPGTHSADTQTAGSCCLLAQVALPPLLYSARPDSHGGLDSSVLKLRGGTDADMAPPFGYLQHVFVPMMRLLFGVTIEARLSCRGFFPQGGGACELSIAPLRQGSCLQPITLTDRGALKTVLVRAFSAGTVSTSVAERMANAACATLKKAALTKNVSLSQSLDHYTLKSSPAAFGSGAGILITAETDRGCVFGSAVPGQRGVRSEDIGTRAATELLEDLASGGCVDRWLEDQLIIFMALADGSRASELRCGQLSLHTRTAMLVAEQMTGATFIVQPPGENRTWCTITCMGCGIAA